MIGFDRDESFERLVPFFLDLSRLFICSANSKTSLPAAIRQRVSSLQLICLVWFAIFLTGLYGRHAMNYDSVKNIEDLCGLDDREIVALMRIDLTNMLTASFFARASYSFLIGLH